MTLRKPAQYGLAAIAAIAAGILGFWLNFQSLAPESAPAGIDALWRAQLQDLNGRPIPMSSFKGRPVIVNFWASWCGPCIEEMPDFQRASQSDAGKKAAFVGIGIDYAKNMRPFADKLNITYTLLESGAQGLDLVRAAGNPSGALPFTLMFDASGKLIGQKLGRLDYTELTQWLAKL